MRTMRLVVAGTPGAGKSTFVRTASQINVVETDRVATDETSLLKKRTTVAFDFGRLTFGSLMELRIYGTPGQYRFNFMWDFLIQTAQTYILLVAAHRPNDFIKARQILSFIEGRVKIPMIIGITHLDAPEALASEEVLDGLGYRNHRDRPPIVAVNPNDRTSVIEALMALMAVLMSQAMSELPERTDSTLNREDR